MIFQILDDKKDCLGIYTEGNFYYGKLNDQLNKTWEWSPHLNGREVDYAKLWTQGKSLEEICPEDLKDRLEVRTNKIKAFLSAVQTAQINFEDVCVFEVIPEVHIKHL